MIHTCQYVEAAQPGTSEEGIFKLIILRKKF